MGELDRAERDAADAALGYDVGPIVPAPRPAKVRPLALVQPVQDDDESSVQAVGQ